MRLAVVSPFVDRRHGTERALAELLERLAFEYGCEIHLYAQRVEDLRLSNRHSPPSGGSGAIFWRKVPSVPGPHLAQFLAWMFFNGFLRRWHASLGGRSFDLVLSPGINSLHPDVVVVHALFQRLQALTPEENNDRLSGIGLFRRMHRRLYYGLLTRLERRIYANKTTSLSAVSHRTAALMKETFHRNDVVVIPNGVDHKRFSGSVRLALREQARQRRGFSADDFVLLLIGNDWRVKGLSTILEAMAALPDSRIKLLVVGNDVVDPFRARAKQLGIEHRCFWEPPTADVLDSYSAADLYVSPSREDSFGLPVAEAMACGLPVITSRYAGVAEYLHDGVDGFVLTHPRDSQSLAARIEQLQTQPELCRRLGEAATKTSLEWNWDRSAAALWELLKSANARIHPHA